MGQSVGIGPWRGRTQIIRFGAASGGRLGDQVAEQIGGSGVSSPVVAIRQA
jgi:hypothetical protein